MIMVRITRNVPKRTADFRKRRSVLGEHADRETWDAAKTMVYRMGWGRSEGGGSCVLRTKDAWDPAKTVVCSVRRMGRS